MDNEQRLCGVCSAAEVLGSKGGSLGGGGQLQNKVAPQIFESLGGVVFRLLRHFLPVVVAFPKQWSCDFFRGTFLDLTQVQ